MQIQSNLLLSSLDRILDILLSRQINVYLGADFSNLLKTYPLCRSIGGGQGHNLKTFERAFKQNPSVHMMCDSSFSKCIVTANDGAGRPGNTYAIYECISSEEENKKFYESCAESGITEVIISVEKYHYRIETWNESKGLDAIDVSKFCVY
jgi:hypothetical protein